jgi:hypothetical protein
MARAPSHLPHLRHATPGVALSTLFLFHKKATPMKEIVSYYFGNLMVLRISDGARICWLSCAFRGDCVDGYRELEKEFSRLSLEDSSYPIAGASAFRVGAAFLEMESLKGAVTSAANWLRAGNTFTREQDETAQSLVDKEDRPFNRLTYWYEV